MSKFNLESYSERFQMAFFTTLKRLGQDQQNLHGVTGPQFYIMMCLYKEGSCKASRLAEIMEVKPSAITVMIDRLVNNGLVIREADAQDRRVVLIGLTEQGRLVLEEVKQTRQEQVNQFLSCLEPDELEIFLAAFDKVAQAANQAVKPSTCKEGC